MKNAWRALFNLAKLILGLYLFIGTAVWAALSHDLESLQQPFYNEGLFHGWSHGAIPGACGVLALLISLGYARLFWKNERTLQAIGALLIPATIAALFFLPTLYTIVGCGALIGIMLIGFLLKKLWAALTWLPRRLRRRNQAATPAPAPAASTKTVSK